VTIRNYLLMSVCALFGLAGVAMADSQDPGILVEGGDPMPMDITVDLGNVQPNGQGMVTFDFINNSNGIVDDLEFMVTIAKGLSNSVIQSAFSISQGGAGYFLNDTISYNSTTGVLKYQFDGVKPSDGDEMCPHPDQEFNEQEGIPACGVFHITLTGWVDNASFMGTQLYSGRPTFTNSFADAPEPSTIAFSGIGLLMLAAVIEFRRRKAEALARR
jgi:hypothetical protein